MNIKNFEYIVSDNEYVYVGNNNWIVKMKFDAAPSQDNIKALWGQPWESVGVEEISLFIKLARQFKSAECIEFKTNGDMVVRDGDTTIIGKHTFELQKDIVVNPKILLNVLDVFKQAGARFCAIEVSKDNDRLYKFVCGDIEALVAGMAL